MARLPLRQKMRSVAFLILHIKMMENMFNMLMVPALALILRRKRSKSDDGLSDLVVEIREYVGAYKEATEQIKDIATYFKKESESIDRRMMIFEEIMQLLGFSRQEVMEAGERILKEAHKIDTFFALPKEFRRDYVVKQLREANPRWG